MFDHYYATNSHQSFIYVNTHVLFTQYIHLKTTSCTTSAETIGLDVLWDKYLACTMGFEPTPSKLAADVVLIKLEPEGPTTSFAPPYGILYLASALERAGFRVRLYHECGTSQEIERIATDVAQIRPLAVGVSSFTGPGLIPSLQVSRRIKARSQTPIIWGGIHTSMLPHQTLANPCVDMVVVGEGEIPIVELMNVIAKQGHSTPALRGIAGVGSKIDERLVINTDKAKLPNLDEITPAWHLLPVQRYLNSGKYFYSNLGSRVSLDGVLGVITSRGCPWRCGYCYNQFVNRRAFRAVSAPKVIAEVQRLRDENGASAVVFEDDCFFTDKERALTIVRSISMPWSASIRANYLANWGDEFIRELAARGCVELRIGAESGSPRVLQLMAKDITVEQIRRSVELCKAYGINLLLGFMHGVPGETWEDMLATYRMIDEVEAQGAVVAAGPALFFPYPGTPFFDDAVRLGFSPPNRTEDWAIKWGPSQPPLPFVDRRARFVGYFRIMAYRKDTYSLAIPLFSLVLQVIARWRWRKRFFLWPIDYYLPRFFLRVIKRLGFGRVARLVYDQ